MGDPGLTLLHEAVSAVQAPVYVCVHIPEFPAQARLRLRPEQSSQAVAVLEGDPPLEQVCSVNNKALALGIAKGMTRAELDCFSGLHPLPRSIVEEETARTALLSLVGEFTPRAEVLPFSDAAFALVLDMTGTTRIFGSPRQAALTMTRAIRTLGLVARLAVSSNFHTAVCMAPFAEKAPRVVEPEREYEALGPLPLAALRLTPKQREIFDLWGLRTLRELAALPEVDLIVRLGQEGKRLLQLARGVHPHLLVPQEPVFSLEEHLAFDAPVEILDSLLFVLAPMLEQIIVRAQTHALALASVTITLMLDGGGEHARTLKPALPLTEREVLLKLMHLDLQAHPPATGVIGVHLQAEPGTRSKVQIGLFSPQLPEPMRLDVTLARIAALVGEGRVGRARLLDTHQVEGFTVDRFSVPSGVPSAAEQSSSVSLRKIRPPVPVRMRLNGLQPEQFFFDGQSYAVAEAYGPWRCSGDWWSTGVWSREEWDVRATTADRSLLCLLVKDLLNKHWQLEALYD
ncbi:MAG: DNA polymerase Y family protein [Janthinobacterium lividum]